MSEVLLPNSSIVFMKIGIHAREPLDEIIKRKLQEIDDAGVAFWGYGGNTCHPTSMVQPFAQEQEKKGNVIRLLMQKMQSNHWAEPVPADEYSIDGYEWTAVPKGVEVRGSRFALVLSDLQEQELQLPLARTRVAVGPNQGKLGNKYVSGRVDKACLEVGSDIDLPAAPDEQVTQIGVVATLAKPYAVFLRNR